MTTYITIHPTAYLSLLFVLFAAATFGLFLGEVAARKKLGITIIVTGLGIIALICAGILGILL